MYVGKGEELFCDIKIGLTDVPREIMLQWRDNSWEHRAYWGENFIDYGVNGSASRYYMGPIPSARDQWVILKIPASNVGLEGVYVNGVSLTLDQISLQYTGTWSILNNSSCYNSSITYSSTKDSTMTYTFNGTHTIIKKRHCTTIYNR